MTETTSFIKRLFAVRPRIPVHGGPEQLLQSLFVMALMVEARDPYTGGHLWRVSQYSHLLARDSDLPEMDIARITLGGFLHDLGKVSVPDAILNKPDRLTHEEYEVIKTHPDIGARLLTDHPLAALARDAVLFHHERPDGAGYPHGLANDQIPMDARIVSICDAFDAMTSNRPCRKGMPIDQALSVIDNSQDEQFESSLAKRFVALGRAGLLNAIAGHSDEGIPVQECPLCGPTIVVRRGQHSGDLVYCRHCGMEGVVVDRDHHLHIQPTGRHGSAHDLEPEPDMDIIRPLVRASAVCLGYATD